MVARGVGLSQLTDEFVSSGDVQDLIRRVFITTTTETLNGSAFAASETVEIKTKTGEMLASAPVVHAKGSAQFPLSRNELLQKFADCLGDAINADTKTASFDKLMNLERLNGTAELLSLQ